MKKFEQLAISLLLVLALLTGCGSNTSDKPQNWVEDAQQSSEVSDQVSDDQNDSYNAESSDGIVSDSNPLENSAAPDQNTSSTPNNTNKS